MYVCVKYVSPHDQADPSSLKLEPQIWVLEWFLIAKPKPFDIPEWGAE